MLQNPFVSTGLIPDEYFCDRVEETDYLIRMLTHGSNVLLAAPRRMGKSKLIDHFFLRPEVADNYYTIYIDLFHTTGLSGFTKAFGLAVFEQILRWDDKLRLQAVATLKSLRPQVSADELTGKLSWGIDWNHISEPELSLKEIFASLEKADKPCIVAFDEFQQITEYPEKGVEALIRGYVQRMTNCNFIFCGSRRHILTEMFTQQSRPFFESVEMMSLAPIAEDKYEAFARHWMSEYGKHLDADVIHRVYQLGEGNTAFLQRTMHHAFDRLSAGETCTAEVTMQAINDVLDAADEIYREKMNYLSERQQDVLLAIANEGHATKILSGAFVKRYNLNSSSAVQAAVKKLTEDGWISESSGTFFLSDTIFRLWLDRLLGKPLPL